MKVFLKIFLSIIVIFVLIGAGGIFYMSRGIDAGAKVTVNSVNPAVLNDGTYNGEYKSGRWSNKVEVTVKDHKITQINVIKDVTFAKPEVTQELISKVIEKQDTNIDTISGATVTCKAYLKAVENALTAGK